MRKLFKLLLQLGGLVAIVAVVLRLTLFVSWTIPNDPWLDASMAPTLRAGDTVLLLTRGSRGFGDLVRCADPEDQSRHVVGRIVGVSGDVVEVRGGILYVNEKSYGTSEACKQATFTVEHPRTGSSVQMLCSRIEMAGGWHFRAKQEGRAGGDAKRHVVGDGRVFLLSDDIDIHDDSRDFGTVVADQCKERIVLRLWSRRGWADSEARLTVIR